MLEKPSADHWAVLAASRFFLSMIVYLGHLGGTIGYNKFTKSWWDFGELAAVVGFFVISGFSIANSIEQRPQRYILRRLWRIWPTYLFSFALCTLPAVYLLPQYTHEYPANQQVTTGMIVGNLFMLQGLLVPTLEANAATWTLAIEEWCYLGAPLFRRCPTWVLSGMILGSAYCYSHASSFGWHRFAGQNHGIGHISFVWAWLLGFVFFRHRRSPWAYVALFLLPVWLLTGANELGGSRSAFTLVAAMLAIGFGGKMLRLPEVLVDWKAGIAVKLRSEHVREFLVFLGNISFPLYIVHYPVFFLLRHTTFNRSYSAYGFGVLLLCVVVYYLVDKPNRKRWQPRLRPAATPEAS